MCEEEETRTPTTQLSLPPQSSASTNSATPPNVYILNNLCPEQDSNLHVVKHTHLKRARLPIPPPGHVTFQSLGYSECWAANGARTRDLDLGKVALYQLSYCRLFSVARSISLNASAKVQVFFESTNFSRVFFQKNAILLVHLIYNILSKLPKRFSLVWFGR